MRNHIKNEFKKGRFTIEVIDEPSQRQLIVRIDDKWTHANLLYQTIKYPVNLDRINDLESIIQKAQQELETLK